MEFVQVFNENKEMLEEKIERSIELTLPSGKYFMIVLIFIENDKHEFLIQKTSVNRGSVFATTGGHVAYGDNNIKTAIKEVYEEVGINILESELKYISTIKYRRCFCDTFYVHKNVDIKDIVVQKEEVEYVKWMSIDDVNNLINLDKFRKGNIDQFNLVIKYLNYDKK